MIQPEGFVNPQYARKVCKLQRSIYGLKQASRSWNLRFDEVVKGFGEFGDIWCSTVDWLGRASEASVWG